MRTNLYHQQRIVWPCVGILSLIVLASQGHTLWRQLSAPSKPLEHEVIHELSARMSMEGNRHQEQQLEKTWTAREVSELLIIAIVMVESAGDPNQVGLVGERGLMQIRETTWAQVASEKFDRYTHFDHAFNPYINTQVGRAYLAKLQSYLLRHRSEWRSDERSLLLACYNAGPMRVNRAKFDVNALSKGVQSYVSRVSSLHDLYLDRQMLNARIPYWRPI